MENILKTINSIKTKSELNAFKNSINESIDRHMRNIIINEEALNISQGSLGSLKEIFENMSPELFKLNEGRKLISLYKKIVKENKDLSRALNIFENLRKIENEDTVEYVIENTNKYNSINKKRLDEGVNNLRTVVFSSYVLLGDNAKNYCVNEDKLYNDAVMVLIEKQQKLSNLADYANSISIIKENVKNRNNIIKEDKHNELNNIIDKTFNTFLNNEGVKTVKSDNLKENAFDIYKNECLSKLSEAIEHFTNIDDQENVNKVKNIHEQVSNKTFSPETVNDDITNLIGITKCFE